jgi:hypothetical protein
VEPRAQQIAGDGEPGVKRHSGVTQPEAEAVFLKDRGAEPEDDQEEQKDARATPGCGVGVDERGQHQRGAKREQELSPENPIQNGNRRLGAEHQTPNR